MSRALPATVVGLGVVSLLTDAASEMVFPLLPLFLSQLGGTAVHLGLIEGVADAVANVGKLVAGTVADRFDRRRPFVIAGYALSALARPCLALATAQVHVAAVRVTDRIGKGLRGAPRDALIARAVPPEQRGEAFGFHRAMDHAGAVLGPLLAIAVLQFVTDDLRTLFWCAAVPGVLAIVAAFAYAREQPAPPPARSAARGPERGLAAFLAPICLFQLGRANDVFLLHLASARRESITELPLLWIGLHMVRSATARLGGRLADQRGFEPAIAAGWLVHAAVFAGLAATRDQDVIRALFLLYGLHAGLSEGAEKALIARIAPHKRLGTAFGWYHFAAGGFALVAAAGFGLVWDEFGQTVAFGASATLAAIAAGWLLFLRAAKP
ncbi:MAG TPA: MFS transporter [Planctomycetota bacterium]|nr:MFS transporter [Planctomycetota bacterium]